MQRSRVVLSVGLLSVLAFGSCKSGDDSGTSETIDRDRETGSAVDRAQVTLAGVEQHPHRAVCGGGRFTCRARIRTTPTGQIQSFASLANVQGFGPPDLQAAYKINTQGGQNATIAIV